jgi:hypothetical protein
MFITIIGVCDSLDDASYERDMDQADGSTKKEIVHQTQVTLTIPGCREVVKAVFSDEVKIDPAWEDKMQMLKVSADKFTVSSGVRKGKAWAVVSFHGVSCEKASDSEITEVNKARKISKLAAKQKRDAARVKLGNIA